MYFDSDWDNTAQALKAAAGTLRSICINNTNGNDCFVQLFNVAAWGVTVWTTTPNYVIPVKANWGTIDDFGGKWLSFSTAITYACTTTATGNGDPTTGLTISAWYI
jgi:hypothetical protein